MKSLLIHSHAVGLILLALMPLSAHGQTVSWVLLEILITGRERDIVMTFACQLIPFVCRVTISPRCNSPPPLRHRSQHRRKSPLQKPSRRPRQSFPSCLQRRLIVSRPPAKETKSVTVTAPPWIVSILTNIASTFHVKEMNVVH